MDKTIEIDDALVKAAQELTGEADARAAIEHIVRRVVEGRSKHKALPSLATFAGKFEFADDYDVLKERGSC
jgi:Arc/MetJ family transcription regulator